MHCTLTHYTFMHHNLMFHTTMLQNPKNHTLMPHTIMSHSPMHLTLMNYTPVHHTLRRHTLRPYPHAPCPKAPYYYATYLHAPQSLAKTLLHQILMHYKLCTVYSYPSQSPHMLHLPCSDTSHNLDSYAAHLAPTAQPALRHHSPPLTMHSQTTKTKLTLTGLPPHPAPSYTDHPRYTTAQTRHTSHFLFTHCSPYTLTNLTSSNRTLHSWTHFTLHSQYSTSSHTAHIRLSLHSFTNTPHMLTAHPALTHYSSCTSITLCSDNTHPAHKHSAHILHTHMAFSYRSPNTHAPHTLHRLLHPHRSPCTHTSHLALTYCIPCTHPSLTLSSHTTQTTLTQQSLTTHPALTHSS